jgi:hypothetical protein
MENKKQRKPVLKINSNIGMHDSTNVFHFLNISGFEGGGED